MYLIKMDWWFINVCYVNFRQNDQGLSEKLYLFTTIQYLIMKDNIINIADILWLMHKCLCRRVFKALDKNVALEVFKSLDKTIYLYVERGQYCHA